MKLLISFAFTFISLFALEMQKPKIFDTQNIDGWYMSEKLDGIRGYWDGKQLLSKNGNPIYAPNYFTKNFPPFALDGELWSQRNDFEFIQNTVLDDTPSKQWENITYNIFEVPNQKGDFISRLQKAHNWFQTHRNQYVKIIKQIKCKDKDDLQNYLTQIIHLKGEGVIIKDGMQEYHTGRSPYILKVKQAQDMEGVIIAHNLRDDQKTLKSLVIKLENGVVFNLGGGLSEAERIDPPKIGEVVTFKYYGFTKNNKPKFASFMRVRKEE